MKHFCSLLFVIMLVVFTAGCGTTTNEETPQNVDLPINWIVPEMTKTDFVHDMSYCAPSNWRFAEASSPDGWYYYPYEENVDGLLYVCCSEKEIIKQEDMQDSVKTQAALISVLNGLKKENDAYDDYFTTISNYPALIAYYQGEIAAGTNYEHKVCLILTPQKTYAIIAAEPGQLNTQFEACMDDLISSISLPVLEVINPTEETSETTNEVDWNTIETSVDILGAYDIINRTHLEETGVLVEGVIDNISEDSFDLWIPYGDSYYLHDDWSHNELLENIKNGDIVQVYVNTYKDGSIAKSNGILAIRKLDKPAIANIITEFKNTCPKMDYKAIMRNPDNAYGTLCKATGTVLQVVKTTDTMQEFLLSLEDDSLVYVTYYKEKGSDNILEDDEVTVYGIFYLTETYTTVLGAEKTVPRLPVSHVDIH